jgi:hypothetical protein
MKIGKVLRTATSALITDPVYDSQRPPGWVIDGIYKQLWVLGANVPKDGITYADLGMAHAALRYELWNQYQFWPHDAVVLALGVSRAGPLLHNEQLRKAAKPHIKDECIASLVVGVRLNNQPVELHFMRQSPLAGAPYAFYIRNHPKTNKGVWCRPIHVEHLPASAQG